ncbi:NTF2-related export protein 2-like [Styela clava]|uniref:NTF2-related export protein 2-like n=1 Tax=Styela clava TaxID=7725 RepID=UPI00193A632D|nr:NTF2-related export protein 2-like [Styela clava]
MLIIDGVKGMADQDSLTSQIEAAIEAGEKFTKIFYETFDKKRHMISKLYHDTAQLLWEGNPVSGKDAIQKFLQDLPGCYHNIDCFDSQPVLQQFTEGKSTVVVSVSGTVKYDSNTLRGFTQNFTLTSTDDVWKIISDSLRLRDP